MLFREIASRSIRFCFFRWEKSCRRKCAKLLFRYCAFNIQNISGIWKKKKILPFHYFNGFLKRTCFGWQRYLSNLHSISATLSTVVDIIVFHIKPTLSIYTRKTKSIMYRRYCLQYLLCEGDIYTGGGIISSRSPAHTVTLKSLLFSASVLQRSDEMRGASTRFVHIYIYIHTVIEAARERCVRLV